VYYYETVSSNDVVTCTGNGDVGTKKPRLQNATVNMITKKYVTLMIKGKIMTDNYRLYAKLTEDTIKSKYRSAS